MKYRIDVVDTWNRRIASFDHVPIMEVTRTTPEKRDTIEGVFPGNVVDLSHGYRILVYVDDTLFMDTTVRKLSPRWSDTRKLILERFVNFHEVINFEAALNALTGNRELSRAYTNRTISQIVKDAITSTLGPVHYLVDHAAYPDGAVREFQKFDTRKQIDNELEVGGISTGQWVDSGRMDLTGTVAKDGDTISGLVVDGLAWPDLRLMMIDSEETSKNSHTITLHGEVSDWTTDQYNASGYKVQGDKATDFLQQLIDTKGIDFIELNPHKNSSGQFDDRVDVFGRYLGFVYGGGECFNAAMVETGNADVLLFDEGRFHVPEMSLKDYFSYTGPASNSIEDSTVTLANFDVTTGLFEVLTALAYAADGYVWSIDADLAVHFRNAGQVDKVIFFDPRLHSVTLGSKLSGVTNGIHFRGNPFTTPFSKSYFNTPSIDEYGFKERSIEYFSVTREEDANLIATGLLRDVAYPVVSGEIEFLHGESQVDVGDILEIRDGALRRLERRVSGEWADRFTNRLVGRVSRVRHRFLGDKVVTKVQLSSPLRSVENPITFIVRSQPDASTLFQLRLDDATVGLDLGFHLD